MLLLPQTVKINWNPRNYKWFTNKGYKFYKRGKELEVNVEDLMPSSKVEVKFICDYCDKIITKQYADYYRRNIKGRVHKDSCFDCHQIKIKEGNILIYGVESTNSLSKVGKKKRETTYNNYGCYYPSQSIEIKEKIKQTNLLRFGYTHPMKDKEFSKRVMDNFRKSMFANGNAPCSTQQKYLHDLLGGELNYLFENLILDIVFSNNIYTEYQGSGHDLDVQLGKISQDKFKKKEINRYYFLKKKGWKMIEIISKKDLLPQDNKIIEIIDYAKNYLNIGHSWIKFDIDNSKVTCSQFEKEYHFGQLRKITKNDLLVS